MVVGKVSVAAREEEADIAVALRSVVAAAAPLVAEPSEEAVTAPAETTTTATSTTSAVSPPVVDTVPLVENDAEVKDMDKFESSPSDSGEGVPSDIPVLGDAAVMEREDALAKRAP